MSFCWIALLHLMADVMGHGGDGGDEPPHPFDGGFGDHQNDVVPPKRRGMAVNKKMHKLYKANGERSLKIVFDVNTNMPIGEVYECFIREVGSYMWQDISFDKDTWTKAYEAERVGMLQYLSRWFDFDAITNHPMASTYWAPLNNRICVQYRDRKILKTIVLMILQGMWRQQGLKPLWNALVAEFALQTHHIANSGGDPDTIDWIAIFENVLGTRRGHVRGIGPKASLVAGMVTTNVYRFGCMQHNPMLLDEEVKRKVICLIKRQDFQLALRNKAWDFSVFLLIDTHETLKENEGASEAPNWPRYNGLLSQPQLCCLNLNSIDNISITPSNAGPYAATTPYAASNKARSEVLFGFGNNKKSFKFKNEESEEELPVDENSSSTPDSTRSYGDTQLEIFHHKHGLLILHLLSLLVFLPSLVLVRGIIQYRLNYKFGAKNYNFSPNFQIQSQCCP
ncbi:unnamed protein product [Lactuca saligna]|uniref:Uncharacterized protein n=1 Tax=Lactuca saligna TaxID=75948 RepID=A0AA35YZ31_LACSI|nr:unnamed protein product [Lactuca saligna]